MAKIDDFRRVDVSCGCTEIKTKILPYGCARDGCRSDAFLTDHQISGLTDMTKYVQGRATVPGKCEDCGHTEGMPYFPDCHRCSQPRVILEDCEICQDQIPAVDFEYLADDCEHAYCKMCCKRYVEEAIANRRLIFKEEEEMFTITCPAHGCNGYFADQHRLKSLVELAEYERYKEIATEMACDMSGAVTCPLRNCGDKIMDVPATQIRVTCVSCDQEFCKNCQTPWHVGLECGQDPNSAAAAILAECPLVTISNCAEVPKIRRCPGCRAMVEWTSACKHMTCYCQHEFCFGCLAPWQRGHLRVPCVIAPRQTVA